MDIGRRRQGRLRRALALLAATAATAVVPLATGSAASAQEVGAPLLTAMTASSTYYTDPCCMVAVEVEWTIDPSGPAADRIRVSYDQTVNVVAGDATWDFILYAPSDVDMEVRVEACAGPVATEVCSERSTTIRTATAFEPIVEVVNVRAWPTGPDRFSVTADPGRTNISGSGYTLVSVASQDPPTNRTEMITSRPYTFRGAVPGATYTIAMMTCIGPTPSSVICGARSVTFRFPEATGALVGTVADPVGRPEPQATVLAYAPGDGIVPTGYTTTAADGTFHFHGLPPGDYAIVAGTGTGGTGLRWFGGTSRRTAALQTVAMGSTVDGLDLALPGATSIRGRVTDAGVPLAGASVWGYADGDVWMGSIVTTTRSDGSYTLPGATTGRYQVAVVRPGTVGPAEWFGSPKRSSATWVEVGTTPATGIDIALAQG